MNERERAERILANLAGVGEDLMALVDDVGHGIDYRDQASLEAVTRFLGGYRQNLDQFHALSDQVSTLISERYGIAKDHAPGNTSGTQARVPVGTQPFGPPALVGGRVHVHASHRVFARQSDGQGCPDVVGLVRCCMSAFGPARSGPLHQATGRSRLHESQWTANVLA